MNFLQMKKHSLNTVALYFNSLYCDVLFTSSVSKGLPAALILALNVTYK